MWISFLFYLFSPVGSEVRNGYRLADVQKLMNQKRKKKKYLIPKTSSLYLYILMSKLILNVTLRRHFFVSVSLSSPRAVQLTRITSPNRSISDRRFCTARVLSSSTNHSQRKAKSKTLYAKSILIWFCVSVIDIFRLFSVLHTPFLFSLFSALLNPDGSGALQIWAVWN